jgi:hypothetical protein
MAMNYHAGSVGIAPALVLALAGTSCVINVDGEQIVVREEHRFTPGAGASLALDTFDGSVQVRSWDRPDVLVEVQKRGPDRETAEALEVTVTQDGSQVRVQAPAPRVQKEFIGIGSVASPSVSYEVSVPRAIALSAETRDGSITVSNIRGPVTLRSGDGSIRAERIEGELNANTVDGSIQIADVNGTAVLESGDGSITVQGRVDALRVRTRDGSVVVEADEGSAMSGDWEVTTGDGSIVFRVPEGFNAEIDAASSDGRVRAEAAGLDTSQGSDERERLRGRLGSGGHVVRLRSGDGSIRVLNR